MLQFRMMVFMGGRFCRLIRGTIKVFNPVSGLASEEI
jgi:hypothetical protein